MSDGRAARWKRLISRLPLGQYFGGIINTVYLKNINSKLIASKTPNTGHVKKVYRKGRQKDFDDDFLYKLMHFSIIRCADQAQQSKSFKSLQNIIKHRKKTLKYRSNAVKN